MLHYHLAIWQSAPSVDFILDGMTWSNDYPTVTTHESWFWHNPREPAHRQHRRREAPHEPHRRGLRSLLAELAGGAGRRRDSTTASSSTRPRPRSCRPRSAGRTRASPGTGARDTRHRRVGRPDVHPGLGRRGSRALNAALAAKGIPLIPNTSAFITGLGRHRLRADGRASSPRASPAPSFAESDWQASTNELLLARGQGKIMILQNYLATTSDVGDAALLPRQLPPREGPPHLPRLLRRQRAARVVPGVGRSTSGAPRPPPRR